ncbi:MAG: STAS domain-containing protein [Anaerolineae bacterium]|jgi:anti-anti-sigma factor
MIARPLRANVRRLPDVAILDLDGDIDGSAEEALLAAYTRAEVHDPPAILLSLGDVDYINSKGIALIVVLLSKARRAGRRLLVCGLSDHYREIFEITRLSEFITVCTDQETALAEAAAPTRQHIGAL